MYYHTLVTINIYNKHSKRRTGATVIQNCRLPDTFIKYLLCGISTGRTMKYPKGLPGGLCKVFLKGLPMGT